MVQICVYLSQRDHNDSPPGDGAEVVYETLILPAMDHFTDFRMNPRGFMHETGEISTQLVQEILDADLVIADLSDLSASGYYQLGLRHAADLPTVLIGDVDYVMPFDAREFNLIRYHFQRSPSVVGDPETVDALVAAIRQALIEPSRGAGASRPPLKKTAKERREDMTERILETAEVIRLLRVNSTSDAVAELEGIARDLKTIEDDATPSALKDANDKALKILFRIMDQLGTVRGARIAIAGAAAMLMGGSGATTLAAFTVALAFWEGKDAFKTFLGTRKPKDKKDHK